MQPTHATASPPVSPTSTYSTPSTADPFAAHRDALNDPFAHTVAPDGARRASDGSALDDGKVPLAKRDRRLSKEWDAAQTPPSRFQRPEGSLFATPASRDGHVARNKVHGFKEKVLELAGKKK